ncbi:MAG: hypothetical protein J6Y28_01700 [Acholeplasmatales bacterium]|nr:hypothetical protein [Methanobrevibacter sp.]MBP5444861.1 hypothetical protein [Acholeplasmatales bacterium]
MENIENSIFVLGVVLSIEAIGIITALVGIIFQLFNITTVLRILDSSLRDVKELNNKENYTVYS